MVDKSIVQVILHKTTQVNSDDPDRKQLYHLLRPGLFVLKGEMKTKRKTKRQIEIELCYIARKHRIAHPRGKSDGGGRWYPDQKAEGGTPAVRSPSRAFPWSYWTACRAQKWCEQLPLVTRREDAAVARAAIETGSLVRDEHDRFVIVSMPPMPATNAA
jgi:hypothetical protein